MPLNTWFRGVLRERMEQAIDRSRTEGWFRHDVIRSLWREHQAGRFDHRKALWSFLVSTPFQASGRRIHRGP